MDGVIVVFSCLHTRVFTVSPPPSGQVVFCPQCEAYREVLRAPHDYSVKCESCTFSRHLGNALMSAETFASNHSLRKAGHRVVLSDSGEEVRVYRRDVLVFDVPPF